MDTAVSASSNPNAAEELFRAAWKIYNDMQELDPKKDSEFLKEFAQCASAEDIMLAVEKRMTGLKDFRDDRWAKLRAKLEPVVVVALQVTTIISGSSIAIPGGHVIPAAVGLLLTATQAQKKKYDTLEKVFEQLSTFLDRFTILYDATLSKRRPGLDQIVTKTLAHLFYVLALSTKFLRESRFRHYGRALIGFPDDLEEALRKFDELIKEEERMTIAYIQLTADQIDKNIEHVKKDLQEVRHVQVDDHIKKWLSASDPSTDRNSALAKRQEGTGDWFFQTEAFKKWKSSGGKPVLWLHGQSGSGKTLISARVVEELLGNIPDLGYFFFVVKAKESFHGMLSSILVLLATAQERSKILVDAYNSDKDKGYPSLSSLRKYFEEMLAVPRDVFLVIDALDEHPAPRDELLRFLTNLSRDHHDRLHLLVTSRNESDIRADMEDIGAVEVDLSKELEQKEDLRKYIAHVLQSVQPFQRWTVSHPDVLDHIKKRLLRETMFRLVALQLENLRLTMPIDVEETLKTLPSSLVEMYDQILQSLFSRNPRTAHRVKQVFEIISCASRPLTVGEVAEVFAIQFNEDNTVQVLEKHRLDDPETELVQMCTSTFIRIEEEWFENTVHFAHASVLDYLQRKHDTLLHSPFCIDRAEAAITLAKLCLCTIHSIVQSSRDHNGPFDVYAHEYWLEEIKQALSLNSVDKIKPLLNSVLLSDRESIPVHLHLWKDFHFADPLFQASPLCCASYLGLENYVRQILIKHQASVDKEDTFGETPLHLASQNGYVDVVQILIKHQASVDKEDSYGKTPLHFALQHGHIDIVQLLIEHQASVDKEDGHGQTPLHLASKEGYVDFVQILIKHQASVDKEDSDGQTPLHFALQHGHIDVAQLLIKHQASVNKEDRDGKTPLHLASEKGYVDVAQVLIEHQASVDEEDSDGQTPLHFALQHGHIDVVQLLIKHQASIDKEDINGQTPLHLASEMGYVDVAQVLIEHQASVDKEDSDGQTPLHLASENGHVDIVQVLIEHQASVDKEDHYGRTPLDLAFQSACVAVVQVLNKHQASVTNTHALLDHFSPSVNPHQTSRLPNVKEGSNRFVMFTPNPKVKRVLDVNLVHILMHESVVCCVHFSADGLFLATGCNRTAQIYITKTGVKVCVLADDRMSGDVYIRSVCFSPDGKFLATGAEDRQIRIWDIAKKRIHNTFDGHQQEIYTLNYTLNGQFLVSGGGDKTVRIWDMHDGSSKVLTINDLDSLNNDAGVTSVAISPNGQFVAAGCLDAVIRIWDLATGVLVERLRGHQDSVYTVAFTPDGKGLVSGSLDKTLKYWDVSGSANGGTTSPSTPSSPTKKDDKSAVASLSGSGTGSSLCTMNFTGHKDFVLSVAVSHDGAWVVSGSKDNGVQFWDAHTAVAQGILQGHTNSVISVDLSPAQNVLATGSGDWEARIWNYITI